MDDLNLPKIDKPLPPPKPMSTDEYAKWVLKQLAMMRKDGRGPKKPNPIPIGKRFKLLP